MFDSSRLKDHNNNGWSYSGNHINYDGAFKDVMPDILNNANLNDYYYSSNGGAYYLRDNRMGYWSSYMNGIQNKLDKWSKEALKKHGITRKG